MVRRFTPLLLLFLFFCDAGFAQSVNGTGSSFGNMPDSLFADEQYPADPEVPFIYSLKSLDISFEETDQSIEAVLNYHVRVKIFDSSVKEAAIVGIPYYFENNIEQVENIRGFTWQNPNEKVPLSPENVRTIHVNSRYNVKEFTMPAVKDGSVIEYTYTVRRRYIEELPDFYLGHRVPTERAEVSITYPKYLRYDGTLQNFSGDVSHFVNRRDTSSVPKVYTYPQPEPIVEETWRAVNIPAVQEETYISSLDDYRGKIKFQLSQFGIPRQTLENSWDYVVAEIRRKQQILNRINSYRQAQKLGKQIADNFDASEATQDSIFQYLNRRVNYSGSKAPYSSVRDSSVLQGEPSDQAAINQTLAAMLQGAGIEAYPLLVSTRESGQINRSFPSFFQFNGQLVHSQIDGKSYFMDASFPFSHPNLIPVEMYNESGLLLQFNAYDWVDIQPEESVFAIKVEIDAALDRQGNLSGTLQAQNAGYPAQQIRQMIAKGASNEQIVKQAVLDGYPDAELHDVKITDVFKGEQSVKQEAGFILESYATSFTGGLDFRPMVVGFLRENPFDDKQRDLPVTLDAPEQLNLSYSIKLPDGMSLDQQPQNRMYQLPGAVFQEQYNISENMLRYEFHIDISRKRFSTDLYPQLLNLYNRWVQLSNSRWRIER